MARNPLLTSFSLIFKSSLTSTLFQIAGCTVTGLACILVPLFLASRPNEVSDGKSACSASQLLPPSPGHKRTVSDPSESLRLDRRSSSLPSSPPSLETSHLALHNYVSPFSVDRRALTQLNFDDRQEAIRKQQAEKKRDISLRIRRKVEERRREIKEQIIAKTKVESASDAIPP